MNLLFRLRSLLLLSGGMCLCLAPFLSWMKVEVLGMRLSLPGFLWHGAWLGLLGAVVLSLALMGGRRAPLILLISLGAGTALLYHDWEQVRVRGEYVLAQWQLRLAPLNQMLAKVNLDPLEIYRHTPPEERTGPGFGWGAAGLGLVGCGWLLGLGLEVRRGASPWSVVLGRACCRDCYFAMTPVMRFCPGCGRSLSQASTCRRCGQELGRGYRFCSSCGEEAVSSA